MTWALLVGYLIGSTPTADLIGRLRGVDLRTAGTGNPGTANALRVVGRGAAVTILILDLLKGAGAALFGLALGGDSTAVAAAVAAVSGQVLNPWFGFRGGKGLGVTGGAAMVIWPIGVAVVLPVIALGATAFRAAVGGTLGILSFFLLSILWANEGWTTLWGIAPDDTLVWFTIGIGVLALPKFVGEILDRGS
ncbi:MAG: glycerol-3-phosphate acyltransferase [Acidimicrobiia bacterium]